MRDGQRVFVLAAELASLRKIRRLAGIYVGRGEAGNGNGTHALETRDYRRKLEAALADHYVTFEQS